MSGDLSLALLRRYDNKIVWNLNQLCNFRCAYCFFPQEVLKREHAAVGRYSVDHICKSFDDTGREWLVLISGGEPFLYREFVSLAKGLTRHHHIQVTTNLTRPTVYDFGKNISPDRVMVICASLHIIEREARGERWIRDFIEKVLFLQKCGFLTLVNYVTYPPLLSRMASDFDRLRDAGIKNLSTLTFRGEYDGRMYPEAYTDEQREMIVRFAIDRQLEAAVSQGLSYQGRLCDAGRTYVQMAPDGTLHRCCSVLTTQGNLFDGTCRFLEAPTPCTAFACQDASLGVDAVVGDGLDVLRYEVGSLPVEHPPAVTITSREAGTSPTSAPSRGALGDADR